MSDFQTIGKSIRRKEGIPKVTGQAVYTDDIELEDCLHGKDHTIDCAAWLDQENFVQRRHSVE